MLFPPSFFWRNISAHHNPAKLPQRMCSTACLNVVEVVNIGKIAEVNIASICGVAFIFLESEANNQMYCIQGIKNAFVIRFKYCLSSKLWFHWMLLYSFLSLTWIQLTKDHGRNAMANQYFFQLTIWGKRFGASFFVLENPKDYFLGSWLIYFFPFHLLTTCTLSLNTAKFPLKFIF